LSGYLCGHYISFYENSACKKILHCPAVFEGGQNFGQSPYPGLLQQIVRKRVHPLFFGILFISGGVEPLQEFCKPDNVNQLMSHYVSRQRKKSDPCVALNGPADHVVLDADFEKITRFASARPITWASQISPDLGESDISDLLFGKVTQVLYIIPISFPFGGRNLVKIAYQLFRGVDSLRKDSDFFCLEG
jgi:hypothetical protein